MAPTDSTSKAEQSVLCRTVLRDWWAQSASLDGRSVLVVKFDKTSMKAGQTNPHDIIRLIENGVKVYACSNLHAKVFSFGITSIVGFNKRFKFLRWIASLRPAPKTNGRKIRKYLRKAFVQSLCGDMVELDYAEEMKKLYVLPKTATPISHQNNKIKSSTAFRSGWYRRSPGSYGPTKIMLRRKRAWLALKALSTRTMG